MMADNCGLHFKLSDLPLIKNVEDRIYDEPATPMLAGRIHIDGITLALIDYSEGRE